MKFSAAAQLDLTPIKFAYDLPTVVPLKDSVGFRATHDDRIYDLSIEGATNSAPVEDNTGWLWEEVFPGVDARLVLRNGQIALQKIVKHKDARHSFRMKTRGELPDGFHLSRPFAIDNFEPGLQGFRLHITGERPITKESHLVESREDRGDDWIEHTIQKDRAVHEDANHIMGYAPIEYPCRVHVLFDYTKVNDATDRPHVGTESDDTTWGTTAATFAYGEAGRKGDDIPLTAGLMWTGVTVDKDATIDDATLTLQINTEFTEAADEVLIYADADLGQGDWSGSDRPSQFTKTTAFLEAGNNSTGTIPYDLTEIVQEIVNLPGWSNGDTIRFGIFTNSASTYDNIAFGRPSNYGDTPFPQLEINWTAAAGGSFPYHVIKQIRRVWKTLLTR